jgi:hypothetical protein
LEKIKIIEERTLNLKRPASFTSTPSNPPSPRNDSSQDNIATLKPPKKVLIVENKSDSNQPTNTPENRSRSTSRNRFSKHLDTHLKPIKHLFEDKTQFNISFDQFTYIIENILKQDNPLNAIKEYGIDGNEIISIIETTRPYLTTKIAKNNYTRIANKMFKALDIETITEPIQSDSNEN